MKKFILSLVVIGIIGGLIWFFFSFRDSSSGDSENGKEPAIEVVERTIEENIEANGIVEPRNATEVRSEISGRIETVLVEAGDSVERGQPLIELDRSTLRNELTEAERNLQSDQLRLEQAERNFRRLLVLSEQEFARESELEDAETAFQLAQLELEVRETRVETARDNLEKATLLAPQAGVVSELTVNEGQVIVGATSVNEGTLLMKVNEMDELVVRASINEVDVNKLEPAGTVLISFDSIPELEIEGQITEISRFGQSESGRRVFPVEVAFPAGDERLRVGVSANLTFPVARADDVPAVLISAVFDIEGTPHLVMVDSSGEKTLREVETGLSDNQYVEILSGAEIGERISLTRPTGMERFTKKLDP